MSEYPKECGGGLWLNDYRSKETEPHFTGNCKLDGKVWKVRAWRNEGDRGGWYKLSFYVPSPRTEEGGDAAESSGGQEPASAGLSSPF